MGKLIRERQLKSCDGCGTSEPVLYRIKVQFQEAWLFVCPSCQLKAKIKAGYQYGGTWKQKKRN
jgi:ribosome-binding protein aMBF1 (putative translation factor)